MMAVLGSLLGGAAKSIIPFAAKKILQAPIAQHIFKTISPMLGMPSPSIEEAGADVYP